MGTQAAKKARKDRTKSVRMPEPTAPPFLAAEGPVQYGADSTGYVVAAWGFCVVTLCFRYEVYYSSSGAAYLRIMLGEQIEERPIVLGYLDKAGSFQEVDL